MMASTVLGVINFPLIRQSWFFLRRCISLSSVVKQDTSTSPEILISVADDVDKAKISRTQKKKRKENQPQEEDRSLRPEEAEEILHFFNMCDHVTLKKLMRNFSHFFKSVDVKDCLERDFENKSCSYTDLADLVTRTKIDSSKLLRLYDMISQLKLKETTEFGIPRLARKFPVEKIKNVETVVGVDIFANTLSWAVMTPGRELLDTGTQELTEKQNDYNPDKHHAMMSSVLKLVPPSNMYIMYSRIPRKTEVHKRTRPYQVLMEALLKLSLNLRMNQIQNKMDEDSGLENFVYHVKLNDLDLFHKIVVGEDLLTLRPFYLEWARKNGGPLRGMTTQKDVYNLGTTEFDCKCIFLADIACRCLAKRDIDFPSAYFPPV